MSAIRLQGAVFCALASAVAVSACFNFTAASNWLLLTCLIAIVLLGVPHGALDTLYASRQFRLRRVRHWAWFTVAYLFPVVLVVWLWRESPLIFLVGFLAISVVHFSADPATGVPFWARVFYGGAAVVLPSLFHAEELRRLFSILVHPDSAAQVQAFLSGIAFIWLAGLCAGGLWMFGRDRLAALELLSVALLCTLAPPLLAFTIFFCGMHSARHILRSFRYAGVSNLQLFAAAATVPMLGTFLALAIGNWWLQDAPLETRLIQLVFVTLAALTVPHMALIERVRFAGWER